MTYFLIRIVYLHFCGLIIQTYYMNFMVGELFCQSLSIKNYQIHASHI